MLFDWCVAVNRCLRLQGAWAFRRNRSTTGLRRMPSVVLNRAFAFFKGTCQRGIHANMKTAVDAVFILI
jgi:hypothetical protein